MLNLRKSIIILVFVCFFMSVSCVCATDLNQNSSDDLNVDDSVVSFGSVNAAGEVVVPETYNDLRDDIENLRPGDVYNIERDYVLTEDDIISWSRVINIGADNVLINGNGHTIDGNGQYLSLFNITGNNVVIMNLNIVNFKSTNDLEFLIHYMGPNHPGVVDCNYVLSPIEWHGDNGVISNCVFGNNAGEKSGAIYWAGNNGFINNCHFNSNLGQYGAGSIFICGDGNTVSNCVIEDSLSQKYGGAIIWKGNNGCIDNCSFFNNLAHFAAGAIYMEGKNNTISNCVIENSTSVLGGDSIFIGYGSDEISFNDVVVYNSAVPRINAASSFNIDFANMISYYSAFVVDEYLNIVDLIYMSIIKGGVISLNDNISYYSSYYNETGDFVFTIAKILADDYVFKQNYHFSNVFNYSFNMIYVDLLKGDFDVTFDIIKTVYINSASDYTSVLSKFNNHGLMTIAGMVNELASKNIHMAKNNPITYTLNVVFNQTLSFYDYDTAWNMAASAFDSLVINGHGSTIRGSFDDSDEDKWLIVSANKVATVYNMTIGGFNTAVENNGGECVFVFVDFIANRMDYWFERDWGAAILNLGMCTCINCSFINNYAKNGGAIFNQGLLVLEDCTFRGNEAYGEGNHVCVGDGGQVIFDDVDIINSQQCAFVHFADGLSVNDITLITAGSFITSFIIGFIVGALTANPAAGVIVGAVVGAAIGSGAAVWIITETYDVHLDRLGTCLALVLGSATCGAIGGLIGGMAATVASSTAGAAPADPYAFPESGNIWNVADGYYVNLSDVVCVPEV